MAVTNLHDTVVTAATKMREYYKVDQYLGGLIKVKRVVYSERVGQEVNINIPNLSQYDNIYINGVEYAPTPSSQARESK